MAHADMAERIEHAFVRQYAVGNRDLVAGIGEIIGHGRFLLSSGRFRRRRSKAEMAAIAKPPGRSARRLPLRGGAKDCLAKAPRCQQIARSANRRTTS